MGIDYVKVDIDNTPLVINSFTTSDPLLRPGETATLTWVVAGPSGDHFHQRGHRRCHSPDHQWHGQCRGHSDGEHHLHPDRDIGSGRPKPKR